MIQPQIFTPFQDHVFAAFSQKRLNFREDEHGTIEDLNNINLPHTPIFSNQPHGSDVAVVKTYKKYLDVDALITRKKNLPLLVKTADCIAALFFDPETKTIAAVHAGWRGLAQKIFTNTISILQKKFHVDPKNLFVATSPSIQFPEFSKPFEETPEFFHPFVNELNQVDLHGIALQELQENGIPVNHIEMNSLCTFKNPNLFWSHRRGDIERNGSIIYLR